jgi:hypothetical protein
VQFRIVKGETYDDIKNLRLLEVNPRMSGGMYYEVLCRMNIAAICMLDNMKFYSDKLQFEILRFNCNKFYSFEDCYVTHVEKAIKIE